MRPSARQLLHVLTASLLILAGVGCSRKFFRERADKDVEGVIAEKNQFQEVDVRSWHVYPDPRSRFADPYNPDRPPMPPDDYAARVLSPNPQHPTKKTGVGRYDGDGYLKMLGEWDVANRAEDPLTARGAPPDRVFLPAPPYMNRVTAQNAPPAANASTTPPAPGVPSPPEASPWVSAKPRVAEMETAPGGPSVIESRDSAVVPASGSAESNSAPTIAAIPVQQPAIPVVPTPGAAQAGDPKKLDQPMAPGGNNDPGAGKFPSVEKLLLTGDRPQDYLTALTTNQNGFRLKLDQAVEIGIINAREFQDARESLYLAALPVTLQRFNLAAQGFFTQQAIYNSFGKLLHPTDPGWSLNPNATTTSGSGAGFSKLFPTGALLMVQLANQVAINFGNGSPTLVPNFALSVTQPFLAGGGFAVTLEPLTQSERTLLYAMQSYVRFRKIFYGSILTGGSLTNNPYGLPGFVPNLGRGIGENLTAPPIGFLTLLQSGAIVINNKKNVESLERYLRQYQAFREGGQLSDLQVGLLEIQLLNSEVAFLGGNGPVGASGSLRGYLDALDNYKLQLGLPLTVALDLDVGPLKPIQRQLTKYEEIYSDVRQSEVEAHKFNPLDPVGAYRPRWRKLMTESKLVKGTKFAAGIGGRWDSWFKLTDDQLTIRLGEIRKQRSDLLDKRVDRQTTGAKPDPKVEIAELVELARLEGEIDLALFERAVRAYETQPWLKNPVGPARAAGQAAAFRDMFNAIYQLTLEARNERLETAHNTWPELPKLPVFGVELLSSTLDDAYTAVIQGALTHRIDMMSVRGQVMDAWRQVAVTANALQGVFNVGYNLTANSPNTQPFAFQSGGVQNQLVINAQLPIVRRAERNAYRAAQINYQSVRRLLMAFEDNIANDVRNDIRQMRALAEDYKIQQRVVELGYSTVENSAAQLFAPPIPGTILDATAAAALTTQLLQAQSNLVNAQNTLYTYWVQYLANRVQLYIDTELMELDERGIWKDEQIPGIDDVPQPTPAGRPGERIVAPTPVGPADRK